MKSSTKRGILYNDSSLLFSLFCCVFRFVFNVFIPLRYPISRSGNNPGRVKRVVSCKRKTHHLTVVRRKQHASERTFEAANKENNMAVLQDAQQEMFHWDSLEHSQNINNNHKTSLTGSEHTGYSLFTEVTITGLSSVLFSSGFFFFFIWNFLNLSCSSAVEGS